MDPAQQFLAYRALMGSPRDERVHWWYVGTMMVHRDGLPPLPVINATTLMVYRLETLSADSFVIHWDEVGYFSDYQTGEPARQWTNPITGQTVQAPKNFQEGPARFIITRAAHGLQIDLQQQGARIRSVELAWTTVGDRIQLVQTERKIRGFPEQDGSLPDPNSSSGFEACTRLAFAGKLDAQGFAHDCHGIYDFALAGMPPWLGFAPGGSAIVNGIIVKTAPGVAVHARAERTLREMFPTFFAKQVDV